MERTLGDKVSVTQIQEIQKSLHSLATKEQILNLELEVQNRAQKSALAEANAKLRKLRKELEDTNKRLE